MSATGSGAASGGVLGLVAVLLLQQLGYLDLSSTLPSVQEFVLGIVVGILLGGVIGLVLGRRYRRRHPEPAAAEKNA